MPPNHNQPPPPKTLPRPKSCFTNPALFIGSWALTLALSPLVFLLLGGLFVYRSVIRFIARNATDLLSPLTPYDCIFAVDSYHTRPYASNLTVLELRSRLHIDSLRSLFKSRILDDPTFQKLYCTPVQYLGYWFWKRLEVEPDINDCVRVYHDSELEFGGGKSLDDCLREIVEMGFRNELFNVFLLHFGNRSVVVFRIHHTVCDGYSFNKLVDKFVGLESKYLVKEETIVVRGKDRLIGIARKFLIEAWRVATLLIHLPLHVSQLYRESLTHAANYYTLPKTSKTGMIRKTILPLSQLKHIRQTSNSHFASTGMALMTGALQKFYDSAPHPQNLRPDRLSIMHSLPRPNHPLNSKNGTETKKQMCNWWGVGLFKIPFTRDSVSRLLGAESDFNEYMGLQYHNVIHIHIPIISLIPCWVVKWFFSINFGTSCGFTSVPGLFDKVAYVGGQTHMIDAADGGLMETSTGPVEVLHMWKVFGLQWRQSAVAVAMYTYRGEASVSVYANKGDIIADERSMDRLLELFHEEFNELVAYSNSAADKKISNPTAAAAAAVVTPATTTTPNKPGNIIDPKFIDACFRNNKLA